MTTDVGIVVGIIADDSGARVIKRSLDDVNKANKDVEASTRGAAAAAKDKSGIDRSAAAEVQKVTTATTAGVKAQRDAETAMRSATTSAREMQRQQGELSKSTTKVAQATDAFRTAYSLLIAGFAARYILKAADEYTVMEARIKSSAGSAQETARVMGELRKISGDTGSEMETSLSILQRLSFVREEIKATNNDMLVFTETVTKLGVTSGALPEAMKAGLTQLGQALSSQYTRAEEFNSIMENIPAVGKAIADELGVTTGQMRLLVVEGKLLSSDVFAAILNQTEKVRAEFEEFPKTASQGAKQMASSFDVVIAQANAASGATNGIGIALRGVGEAAKVIYNGLGTAFDYLVAGIQEGVNLIDIAINKVKQSINDVSKFIPGYGGTNFSLTPTVEVGGVFAAANAARKEREKALFGDDFAATITPQQRQISQDYGKIAAGLNVNKDAARAAKKAQRDAERAEAKEQREAASAAKKEQREAAAEQKRQQNELESAINGSRTEAEKLNEELAHLQSLKTGATVQQIELLNRGIRNTQADIDKLALKAELDSPLAKGFAAVADEVQDGFKDAFKGAFDGGGSLFQKFADGIKATFKSLLLDLAYQAAVRPIVVSVLTSVGGSLGLSGSALSSVLGTGAGGSKASGGFSLLSSGSSLFSAGKAFLGGKSLTAGLGANSLGLSTSLGFGAEGAGNIANFITKAGTFGSLAGGFAGGLGANLLGLGNKNGYVSGAGGTIGGIIGGGLGGPLGAAAGSFLGTAVTGLFGGGKPSDKAVYGGFDLSTGKQFGQGSVKGGSDANNAVLQSLYQRSSALVDILESGGATVKGKLFATVGSRDGLRLGTGSSERNFGTDVAAFTKAAIQEILNGASGLGATFKKILGVTGTGNLDKLGSRFQFGQSYDATLAEYRSTPAKTLADALKALDDNMNDLLKTATKLGLPTEEYTKALQKQKDAQVGALKAQQAGFSSLEEMTRTFDSFFNSQALGETSSLNPLQKLGVAQSDFGNLLSKAQGGDLSVTQDLLSSANTLLGIGRDTYASGADFTGLESFVKSSVSTVAKQSGYNGQNLAANLVGSNQAILAKITELVELTRTTQADTFRLANKAAVGA